MQAITNFFEDRQMLSRDEFLRVLRKSQEPLQSSGTLIAVSRLASSPASPNDSLDCYDEAYGALPDHWHWGLYRIVPGAGAVAAGEQVRGVDNLSTGKRENLAGFWRGSIFVRPICSISMP